MIPELKDWFAAQLLAARLPEKRVHFEARAHEQLQPKPYAVVVIEKELVQREGRRVGAEREGGVRRTRRRLFRRELPVLVDLVAETEREVEALYVELLRRVFGGFRLDGNYHPIRVGDVAWQVDPATAQKKTMVTVELRVEAGVFEDTVAPVVTDVQPEPEGA